MAKIISVANQKGGVGKTTTAWALVTGLKERGYKVLAVDIDPQSNLSYVMQADEQRNALYEVLKSKIKAQEAVQKTKQGDIIPSTLMLAGADMEFTNVGREYILKNALKALEPMYDYIIIDTPPTLGILTINALTASGGVVIPMGADIFSLQGLSQLYDTVNRVKEFCNPELNIIGILITRYNNRTILSRDLFDVIKRQTAQINAPLFKTVIREGISIKEAQTRQKSLYEDNPDSNAIHDYSNFVNEYLKGVSSNG